MILKIIRCGGTFPYTLYFLLKYAMSSFRNKIYNAKMKGMDALQ